LAESSQPPRWKNYRIAKRIQLATDGLPTRTLGEVLSSRRTCRSFSVDKLSLQSLSTLLNQTWGVHGYVDAPPFGRLLLKTSPSAGARHPVEVYVLINRVEGIRQGLYHYDGRGHQLVFLRKIAATRTVEYGAGQSFMKDAAALFIMTAVFPRVQWKYRFGRAYRTVLLDAGHLCQTFYLVATSLGLGPFCTALFRDDLIEKDLSLDTVSESALYIAGVGVPRSPISADNR
jgi:SagB-type dehydrogenase family enzyme